jgi:propanol-preferring alcohol dehydrogenase
MHAKTMKAAAFKNPGDNFSIEIIDKTIPTPKEGEVLVRLNVTGLCHSDLHLMMAGWDGFRTQMQTVGHEGAGVVEELGRGVEGWKVGDRAGVKPISSVCFSCGNCGRDLEAHCPKAVFTGINMEGTYQQYICVPAFYATHIPDGVDDFAAAPIMCSGTTAYRSLMASGLKIGQWAVFPGAGGGVGHMVVQVAKAMGIRCIAIEGGDEKRALCMELGAEEYIDFASGIDVEARIKTITGGGADAVIVTSSSAASYTQAPGFLRVGGTVMCLSMPPSGKVIAGADPNIMTSMGLTVKGTMVGSLVGYRPGIT